MIRRLYLVAFLLFASSGLHASEDSPDQFIKQLIDDFNSGNLAAYQDIFHYPYSRVINGQIEIFTDQASPALNYQALRESGWVRSRINELEVLDQSGQSAIVRMNFSRINSEDREYLRSDVFYTVSKSEDGWKVISMSLVNSLPVGLGDG